MEAFWKAWAARTAQEQWYIYGDRRDYAVPEVVEVVLDATHGSFQVHFDNGDVLVVEPPGLARPRISRQ